MGGEIDRILSQSGLSLARLTIDFFRPVPLEPMTLSTTIIRSGRRVQVIDATLTQDDRVVARASGLGFRTADHDIPFGIPEPESWPEPPDTPPVNYFERPGAFATDAMEVRMAEGDFDQPGPGVGWFRLLVPVLETEPTPVETTCAAADFANGVSTSERLSSSRT